jgi:hypothetical protein
VAAAREEARVGEILLEPVPGQVLARRRDVLAVAAGPDPGLQVGRGLEHAREEPAADPLGGHPRDPGRPLPGLAVDPACQNPDRPLAVGLRLPRGSEDHVEPGGVGPVPVVDLDREPAAAELLEQRLEPGVGAHGEETGHGDAPYGRM